MITVEVVVVVIIIYRHTGYNGIVDRGPIGQGCGGVGGGGDTRISLTARLIYDAWSTTLIK